MELFVLALTVAFVLRDPPGTIRAATAYKRTQIQKAERAALQKGMKADRPGHRAFRDYLGTVWEAQWEHAMARYPDKMRAAKERRKRRWDKGKALAGSAWSKSKDTAVGQWNKYRHGDDGGGEVPEGVVDLAEERRRRDASDTDDAPTTPKESPVDPTGDSPNAETLDLSDSTSLSSHLRALRSYATYWGKTCTAKERLAAGMRSAQVGEATVSTVDASRAASSHSAAQARAAADALEQANAAVAEARAGSPEAGHGAYYERH